MKRGARLSSVAALILAAELTSTVAFAHNEKTHQMIVNHAWQVMRAANRTDLSDHIDWNSSGTAQNSAPDLQLPGDCAEFDANNPNLCGKQVTPEEWTEFLHNIQVARQHLSGIPTSLPSGCSSDPTNQTLGSFAKPIGAAHLAPGCDYGGLARRGIFDDFSVPDDGAGNQGLILGWHSQSRDRDQADSQIDVAVLQDVAHALQAGADAFEIVLGTVLVPIFCIFSFFTGDNDCASAAYAAADDVNVTDFLKNLVPSAKSPWGQEDAISFWHFINIQGGVSNEYDDHQGLFYDEAGPRHQAGAVDQALILLADATFLTLDASDSAGTQRYELTADEIPLLSNHSSDRGAWRWQMETFAHIAMSPIDNFALFGDIGRPNEHPPPVRAFISAFDMGWPLHAIADVSVPAHVVGTTGWGHRPYEDATQNGWDFLTFQGCQPSGDPLAFCLLPEPGSPAADPNAAKVEQMLQAQRVLQEGFHFLQVIGESNDLRDFITKIAMQTFGVVNPDLDLPDDIPTVWCDTCSTGYAAELLSQLPAATFTNEWKIAGIRNPVGYYMGTASEFRTARGRELYKEHILKPMRRLLEQSMAATLAYLVSRGASDAMCDLAGESCGNCCTDRCGTESNSNICCRKAEADCYDSSECCSGSCVDGLCLPALGETCHGTTCAQGQCLASPRGREVCCESGAGQCKSDSDCCSGVCTQSHTCLAVGSCPTTACSNGRDCEIGKCCLSEGTGSCNEPGDCCSGICTGGQCVADLGGQCSTDGQCGDGTCVGGRCCRLSSDDCTFPTDCCSGLCVNGQCVGLPDGSGCSDPRECASFGCDPQLGCFQPPE